MFRERSYSVMIIQCEAGGRWASEGEGHPEGGIPERLPTGAYPDGFIGHNTEFNVCPLGQQNPSYSQGECCEQWWVVVPSPGHPHSPGSSRWGSAPRGC